MSDQLNMLIATAGRYDFRTPLAELGDMFKKAREEEQTKRLLLQLYAPEAAGGAAGGGLLSQLGQTMQRGAQALMPGAQAAPAPAGGGYEARVAQVESGGNPAAKNPNSTATGKHQFIESTWLENFDKTFPDQVHLSAQQKLQARTDPRISDQVFKTFTAGNEKALSGAGVPVNDVSRYAAHFFGAGDAARVLQAPDDTPLRNIVSAGAIQANPHLQNMTARDARNWLQQKMGAGVTATGNAGEGLTRVPGQEVPGMPAHLRAQLPALLSNPQTRAMGMQLAQQYQNPEQWVMQRDAQGNLLQRNTKTGETKIVDKSSILSPIELEQKRQLAEAGSTKVSVSADKGEGAFDAEFGKRQADRWNKIIGEGQAAERSLVDIQGMRDISRRLGSQGAAANIKEAIGPYAEALNVPIAGLDDIQAFGSIIQRLAPQQRAEGSGSTSDIEYKGFLKALPQLSMHPQAREAILDTMEALERDKIARAEVGSRLATKELSRTEAEKALRALPDPLEGFRQWRKANPQEFGRALKESGNAPRAPERAPQQQNAIREGQTATNPQTGQKIIYRGGQWVPVQ